MPVSIQPKAHARRQTCAVRPKYRRLVLRPLMDAALAGLVFTLVSTTLMCNHARAGTSPAAFAGIERAAVPTAIKAVAEPAQLPVIAIATASSPADAIYRRTSVSAAWALLGVAFSLMAALNLAVLRHLKRAYVTPVRRFPQAK
jgi:hypothetical protein